MGLLLSEEHSRDQGRMVPILVFFEIAMHFWIENSPKISEPKLFQIKHCSDFSVAIHTEDMCLLASQSLC